MHIEATSPCALAMSVTNTVTIHTVCSTFHITKLNKKVIPSLESKMHNSIIFVRYPVLRKVYHSYQFCKNIIIHNTVYYLMHV